MQEIISSGQASDISLYSFEYAGVVIGMGSSGAYFEIAPNGYLRQQVSLTGANNTNIAYRIIGYGSMRGLTITVDAWDTKNSVFAIKTVENDNEEYQFKLDILSANTHSILIKNPTANRIRIILISALLEVGSSTISDQVNTMSDKMILYGYEHELPQLIGGELTV
jgi:hypothetical protein